MGWKTFRDHFQIKRHIVSIDGGLLLIGSDYIRNIVQIELQTGKLSGGASASHYEQFLREAYPLVLQASYDDRLALIRAIDSFDISLPVFTYEGARILEKQCEKFGWPNVTHDGILMHNNLFFPTREQAADRARVDADARIESYSRHVEDLEEKLRLSRQRLHAAQLDKDTLQQGAPPALVSR